MALFDFLDPEAAKIAQRLANIKDNVTTPSVDAATKVANRLSNIKNIPMPNAGAAPIVTAPAAKATADMFGAYGKSLDLSGVGGKVGGVLGRAGNFAKNLITPAAVRTGGVIQAGVGGIDMARNGANLENTTDVAAGALTAYNPVAGTALNAGILGGKLLATGADKLGLLDPLKPNAAAQGPAFAAAQAKFNADPRPQDIGFQVPKYPTPQIAFSADQIARGDIPQAQFTAAELAAIQRDSAPRTPGVGGGGRGVGVGATRAAAPAVNTIDENGVLVDRGGVLSMDNFYGDREYGMPGMSDESKSANLMRYLSSEAQKAYNATTIQNDEFVPVQGVDRFGNEMIQYTRKTNVTPGINIGSALQAQVAGVAPRPVDERIAADKNAADIQQQQIAANATLGAAQIGADPVKALTAKTIANMTPAQQAALVVEGNRGYRAEVKDKYLPVFEKEAAAQLQTLTPERQLRLTSYLEQQNPNGAQAMSALTRLLAEQEAEK